MSTCQASGLPAASSKISSKAVFAPNSLHQNPFVRVQSYNTAVNTFGADAAALALFNSTLNRMLACVSLELQ